MGQRDPEAVLDGLDVAAALLGEVTFECAVASDARRAQATARAIAPSAPLRLDARLRERSARAHEGGADEGRAAGGPPGGAGEGRGGAARRRHPGLRAAGGAARARAARCPTCAGWMAPRSSSPTTDRCAQRSSCSACGSSMSPHGRRFGASCADRGRPRDAARSRRLRPTTARSGWCGVAAQHPEAPLVRDVRRPAPPCSRRWSCRPACRRSGRPDLPTRRAGPRPRAPPRCHRRRRRRSRRPPRGALPRAAERRPSTGDPRAGSAALVVGGGKLAVRRGDELRRLRALRGDETLAAASSASRMPIKRYAARIGPSSRSNATCDASCSARLPESSSCMASRTSSTRWRAAPIAARDTASVTPWRRRVRAARPRSLVQQSEEQVVVADGLVAEPACLGAGELDDATRSLAEHAAHPPSIGRPLGSICGSSSSCQ